MTISEFEQTLNDWGRDRVPFLFIVDFEMQKPVAIRLTDIDPEKILYDLNGFSNFKHAHTKKPPVEIKKYLIDYDLYQRKFDSVSGHLKRGDSFLTNLTIKTEIEL